MEFTESYENPMTMQTKRPAETILLSRDCPAVQIPAGTPIILPYGTQVMLMQSLGGSFTVTTDRGYMVRINGQDADALGMEPLPPTHAANETPHTTEELESRVWELLKTCYDPEIPVNIVDLGLIYECRTSRLPEGDYYVEVRMTLTAPGCGMGGVLKADVEEKIKSIPGVKETFVELSFDPPWDQSRMTEAAKLQLNLF